MTYQHYPKQFGSFEEALAYLKSIGKMKLFGVNGDYYVYNLMHKEGRGYHVNIYKDGRVEYKEMSPIVYAHWKNEG